jgi:predicted  nucleic acid-binding Zn-ribbon protein
MMITSLADLLEVQALDLDIDRLLDRRQGLPQIGERRLLQGSIEALEAERATAAEELRSIELALDKAEGELEMLETKLKEHETRLFAGGLSGRETEYMRLEVQSLRGQDDALEGRVLQMLEDVEPSRAVVADLDEKIAAAMSKRAELDDEIAAEWKVIDADLARKEEAKSKAMAPIEPGLLEIYEKLRRSKEGVAIAVFDHGVCGGCHMALSPSEQEEVLREEMPRCVHCRRILVA